jgi:hypothetical protein
MPNFAPRQIFIAHESLWNAMQRWAADHNFHLDRIPDGADENGVPFFREDKPETECPQCGHTPTYSFMSKTI